MICFRRTPPHRQIECSVFSGVSRPGFSRLGSVQQVRRFFKLIPLFIELVLPFDWRLIFDGTAPSLVFVKIGGEAQYHSRNTEVVEYAGDAARDSQRPVNMTIENLH